METDGLQHFTFRDRHGEVLGNRVATEFGDEERPPPGPLEHHPDQLPLGIDASTARPIGGGERLTDFGANVWMHALLTAA
mgnify:CR=1 FL=1